MLKVFAKLSVVSVAALAVAGCESMEPAAEAVGPTYMATLTGATEVPGPGDPDGSGMAEISIVDAVVEEVCYEMTVTGIAPATAAHIHRGAFGESGPPVVTLEAPTDGEASGCTATSDAIVDAIQANPGGFYVNVHNAEYPGGAVRGQLRR